MIFPIEVKRPSEFAEAARTEKDVLLAQHEKFCEMRYVQTFVDCFPHIFIVLNSNREIVYTNQKMIEFSGAESLGELIGLRVGEALSCNFAENDSGGCGTTEHCSTCGSIKAIMNGLQGRRDMQECRITRRNGLDPLDLRVWANPYIIGEERYLFLTATDISSEKRKEVLERIFFHDILNVAGGLRGLAEIMRDVNESDNEVKSLIFNLTERLIDEIQAQRQLSMAESNDLIVNISLVSSFEMLVGTAETYRKHNLGRGKKIVVAEDSLKTYFKTDPTILLRVLGNMLKNALEASSEGDAVELSCCMTSRGIRFTVRNSGYMDKEVRLQVFQRSFSTKGAGRGLGTYSIKMLTEKYLMGKAGFSSEESEGTEFYVELPLNM